MQALNPAEVQDILNVTVHSIARHCGLIDDPSNPDSRSEERRLVGLKRQLGVLRTWPVFRAQVVSSEFSAKYLPALVTMYRQYSTPYNIATVMMNDLCHLPYFVRYQRTSAASDLVVLQATRMANTMDDQSDPQVIAEVCQFLLALLILQGATAIPEDVKKKLIQTVDAWRRRYQGQFTGETSDRCYQSLEGTQEMILMARMVRDTVEKPLDQCGLAGCGLRVDSFGPELQQCSRCKSAVYCGPTHQKQHWPEHKTLCFPPAF